MPTGSSTLTHFIHSPNRLRRHQGNLHDEGFVKGALVAQEVVSKHGLADPLAVGKELGFREVSGEDFVWCGKRFRRRTDGAVTTSIKAYQKNLKPIYLAKTRRSSLTSPLSLQTSGASFVPFSVACGTACGRLGDGY